MESREVIVSSGEDVAVGRESEGDGGLSSGAMLGAALSYIHRGWVVLPLHEITGEEGRCSCGRSGCSSPGKHPRISHGVSDASGDESVVRGWWSRWPSSGIGIATGHAHLVVIDLDPSHGGEVSWAALVGEYGREIEETLQVRTGGGGRHLYYLAPGLSLRSSAGSVGRGIDVRARGGYVVAPPSLHSSGNRYQWVQESVLSLREVPPPLVPLLQREGGSGGREGLSIAGSVIPEGQRNTTLFRMAGALRRLGMEAEEIVLSLEAPNKRCVPPLSSDEVWEIARGVMRYPPQGLSGSENGSQSAAHASAPADGESVADHGADSNKADTGGAVSSHHPGPRGAVQSPPPSADWAEEDWDAIFAEEVAETVSFGGDVCPEDMPADDAALKGLPAGSVLGDGAAGGGSDDHGSDGGGSDGEGPDTINPRFTLTDRGNARRLVLRHGDDLRYCKEWKSWLVWDGARWCRDWSGHPMECAKETTLAMLAEAQEVEDPDERQKLVKNALASQSFGKLSAMVTLAQSDPRIAIQPGMFNTHPYLLTCPNGTVDLRTGELRPHDRTEYSSKCTRVPYDPHATAPMWEACLARWMDGNVEMISFLQRAVGYSLTGSTGEEVIFFAYGPGRNGKSKFIRALQHVLADYAKSAPAETLLVKHGSSVPNDLAALVGARLVASHEVQDGRRLAEDLVKQITGGDVVSVRQLYGEFFEDTPTYKIWMVANNQPAIKGADAAIWSRILVVPFTVVIPPEEQIKNLTEILAGEAAGIQTWAVQGCVQYMQEGLNPPPEVKSATASYREEMDTVGRFVEECCEVTEGTSTPASVLWETYKEWCHNNNEREGSRQYLGRALKGKGFVNGKTKQSVRVWEGITVLER